MQALPDQRLVVVLAAEDVSIHRDLRQLLIHDIITHLTLPLHRINLLLQRVPLLVVTACTLLHLFQLLEKPFFLTFQFLMLLLGLTEGFFSLHETLLGL